MAQELMKRLSEQVRHRLPVLLVAVYAIAVVVPGPGQIIRGWDELPEAWPDLARPNVSQLLVAVLLGLAALGVEIQRVPIVARRPALLLSVLAAVWIVPSMVVLGAWWLTPLLIDSSIASMLVLGFTLVAAMPVANSAAAWTQQSRGELPWALALVVLSIVVCPWMIPLVLKLLGLTFSDVEAEALFALTTSFTGMEFVLWVLLPTAVGMLVRWIVGAERVARHRQAVLLWSAATLLLLNYINAACALPQMWEELRFSWLVLCVATALTLCLAGWLAAHLLERCYQASEGTGTALDYTLTMKNTGLALALAYGVLENHEILLLPVFTMTLVQHLFASALHRNCVRRMEKSPDAQSSSS